MTFCRGYPEGGECIKVKHVIRLSVNKDRLPIKFNNINFISKERHEKLW